MKKPNTTHQQRIAKALHHTVGCGYQEALRRVREAAAEGLLPVRLDAAGRAATVEFLAQTATATSRTKTTPQPAAVQPISAPGVLPWSDGDALAPLAPGTVTGLVSLPTAGRSTLALNIALHNAQIGTQALFTSGEISFRALQQKVLAARYGVDVRRQEPPGGWTAFKATVLSEMKDLPLALHGARASSSARDSLRQGLLAAAGANRRLKLWIVDSVLHFSDLADDGPDTAATMAELHSLASEYNLAVLVTSRVVTQHPDESVTTVHLPAGMAEHSDHVLALDRAGVYWTHTPSTAATLRQLTGPAPGRGTELELQPDRCRFVPA
ncbi:DnaB-like helicase C-terminal domain-containing protein [Streptomyces nigrescens]|uniref:DnaB-like helicase C-terminal domain-containing protein n=1 Tax=Streptomyces nigrescens TaxID=1920 RepID=UPI00225B6924|nr:DnaB-like helicase C-terminal domain-containing protein [Streptomyces libani]MCX5450284.1 hypothetical protein [Streptomyces libani]